MKNIKQKNIKQHPGDKLGKPRLLIFGCGDVGLRLLALLTQRLHVFALTTQPSRYPKLRAAGAIG